MNSERHAGKLSADFLILQTGGLGDLVLTADLVAGLKRAHPTAKVALVCRAPVASIAKCYPSPPDYLVGLEFHPYRWAEPSEALLRSLEPALIGLREWEVGTFIAANLKPTWFDGLVAATLGAERNVGCFREAPGGALLRLLLRRYGLSEPEFSGPEHEAGLHEKQRYQRLLRYLGIPIPEWQRWIVPQAVREEARTRLATLGLEPGAYLLCFPLGAGPALRWWPAERYRQLIRECHAEYKLPVLMTGARQESEALQQLVEGLPGSALFLGGPEELPLLAGLIAHAHAYLGNDTGPMHVAAALGIPGVALYGGGAWPAYAPWAAGSIGLVYPLPCFGCVWDCMFGRGICLESIRAETVGEALQDVLRHPPAQPEIRIAGALPEETEGLIADANRRYREAQQVARQRLEVIMELEWEARRRLEALEAASREAENLRAEVRLQEQAARERLEALEAARREAENLRIEAARREQLIRELSQALRTSTQQ